MPSLSSLPTELICCVFDQLMLSDSAKNHKSPEYKTLIRLASTNWQIRTVAGPWIFRHLAFKPEDDFAYTACTLELRSSSVVSARKIAISHIPKSGYTQEDFVRLFRALAALPNLEELPISPMAPRRSDISARIADLTFKNLTVLKTHTCAAWLARYCPKLVEMDVQDCSRQDASEAGACWEAFLRAAGRTKTLRRLFVPAPDSSGGNCEGFWTRQAPNLNHITCLSMEPVIGHLEVSLPALATSFSGFTGLKELHLPHIEDAISDVSMRITHVWEDGRLLGYSDGDHWPYRPCVEVIAQIVFKYCPSLETINFSLPSPIIFRPKRCPAPRIVKAQRNADGILAGILHVGKELYCETWTGVCDECEIMNTEDWKATENGMAFLRAVGLM